MDFENADQKDKMKQKVEKIEKVLLQLSEQARSIQFKE